MDNEQDQDILDDTLAPNHNSDIEDSILEDWDTLGGAPPADDNPQKDTTINNDDEDDEVPPTDTTDTDTDTDDTEDESDEDGIALNLVPEDDAKYNESLVVGIENLLQTGYLELEDEAIIEMFDGTQEGYDKVMAANEAAKNQKALDTIWNGLPEKGRDFFKYLNDAGAAADVEGFLKLDAIHQDLEAIDVDKLTTEQAKEYIQMKETERGTKDKFIKIMLQTLEDDDELVATAKELLVEDKAAAVQAKADKLEADKEANAQFAIKQQEEYNNTLAAIQGTKFSTEKQKEIYNMIYTVDETSNTSPIVSMVTKAFSNPEHLIQLITLFEGYTPDTGFDIKRVSKQIKTEVTNRTKKTIRRNSRTSHSGGGATPDKAAKSWTPSDEELGIA